MGKKFSKEKFLKDATPGIRRQLNEHLDILDGMEVIFDGKYGQFGYIEQYFVNGQKFYLYPVYEKWCDD